MRVKWETQERITTTFHPVGSKGQRDTEAQKDPRDLQDMWDHLGQMSVRSWISS